MRHTTMYAWTMNDVGVRRHLVGSKLASDSLADTLVITWLTRLFLAAAATGCGGQVTEGDSSAHESP